ncbi:hypothetical protein Tco_0991179 [Tanacetum coccineum]|uniref:Uncharacterized protein n=1 Tax=Tanacetum coccineum TaxID=301880 RepID=A0ABQ5EYT0_9ASTR
MSTILALSYPSSNNQLEISSTPMHQVAMRERQTLSYVDYCSTGNDHIARPYTQSNKIQYLKQQMLLAQLQEAGIHLSKDQLAILADTGERIDFGPGAFTVTTNAHADQMVRYAVYRCHGSQDSCNKQFKMRQTINLTGLLSREALLIRSIVLEEQIRRLDCRIQYAVLGRRFDTSYPTGGYDVSGDQSE